MNIKITKKFGRYIQIESYLNSIEESTNVARDYIAGDYKVNDIDELIVSLECVHEYIEEIKEQALKMSEEYEIEIEELRNEQL